MVEIIDEYSIDILDNTFKITTDAVELFNFIDKDTIRNKKILEVGFGSGYISLKLLKYSNNIKAIDIQKEVYEQFKTNIEKNNIKNLKIENIDFRKLEEKFDIIVSNPPYFKKKSGKYPQYKINLISKFEIELELSELFEGIEKNLLDNGIFYLVHLKTRYEEIKKLCEKHKLRISKCIEKNNIILLKILN